MNKIAIIALACAAPVMAGTPVVIAPAPAPAPAVNPWSVEIGVGYNFAGRDLVKHSVGGEEAINTLGVDLTGVYAINDNSALTIRFGYSFGDEVDSEARSWGERLETDVHTFSLMPGYRYTHALTDKVSAFCGVNVGVANMSVKDHARWMDGDVQSWHDSAWGFGYSAEAGLRYALCPNTEIFAAYQFSGNTARLSQDKFEGKNHRQFYNGIRTGVSIKF